MFRFAFVAAAGLLSCVAAWAQSPASLGLFEGQTDVGEVLHPGSAEYDAATKTYTVSGSGENMWFAKDEFHYVWKKVSAQDFSLSANISILGAAEEGHRKGVLMIRQSLDGDAAYVDVARHGDGLTSLQFRDRKGAATSEIESNVSGPVKLRLEKQGDRFYMWIAGESEDLKFSGGSARVEMQSPFYVGIGVCAHRKDSVEKVAFTNVEMSTAVPSRKAKYSTIETVLQSTDARSGYVSTERLTSPGWTPDGKSLTFDLGGQRQQTPFTPLKTAAPAGPPLADQPPSEFVYFASTQSGTMQIWRKMADSSHPEQVTSGDSNNVSPFLSPSGKQLLYLSYPKDFKELPENKEVALRMMSLADKTIKTLATFTGGQGSLGTQPWSPDGRRVVFVSYQSMN